MSPRRQPRPRSPRRKNRRSVLRGVRPASPAWFRPFRSPTCGPEFWTCPNGCVGVNASAQTDPVHTKLMKEVSTDEPKDLIPMVDEEILTDGNLVIREIGNFILTHSVAQMTESVPTLDAATQTALPRSGISFRKFLDSGAGDGPAPKVVIDEAPSEKGVETSSSLEELIKMDEKIKQFFRTSDLEELENLDDMESSHSNDSIKEQPTPDLLAGSSQDAAQHKSRFLEPPAFNSWQNLDFSDEESEHYVRRELPRRSIGEGNRPWAEFKDLVIGSRLANMRLSPIPPRRPRPNKKTVTWSDTQHRAVSDLLHEATALVDMFDHVSMLLGPDIKLHSIPPQEDFKLPPPKWEPLLTKSCDLLEEKLAKVRHLTFEDLDNDLLLQPVKTQPINDLEVTL
ncbi:AAEL002814-PA [Aedes aegypti]|uniref:AAEL002814-PA n=1 Tax=Aedes aegypti TaxID=7159 RepID=Q17H32_AEDAE|nr:AAEL002814-PA [Aedes aegypti]